MTVASSTSPGAPSDVLEPLANLFAAEAHRDDVAVRLAAALYRLGRQHEALTVIKRLRRSLGARHATVPMPEVDALETAIVRHELPTTLGRLTTGAVLPPLKETWSDRRPPPMPGPLLAREDELARLSKLVDRPDDPPGIRLVTVEGVSGIGKSALVTEWAATRPERVRYGRFDGGLGRPLTGWYDAIGDLVDLDSFRLDQHDERPEQRRLALALADAGQALCHSLARRCGARQVQACA